MTSYIKSLKDEGYTTLREEYYNNLNSFPSLGKPIEPNDQDPDLIDREDQTNNADDDDEIDLEQSTAEDNSKETDSVESPATGDTPSTVTDSEEPVSAEEPSAGQHLDKDPLVLPEHPLPEGETQVKPPSELESHSEPPPHTQILTETKDKRPLGTKMKVPTIQVKKSKEVHNPPNSDSLEEPVKPVQSKLKPCSVSLLKPLPGNPPLSPTSQNQSLLSPKTPSQVGSPTTKPNQGLNLLEYPLIRFMTEQAPYSNDEVKLYVIQAIKQGEITFKTVHDEVDESPFLSKSVLKGCKENSLLSNRKKAQYKKVEDKVLQVSRDPIVREEAAEEGKKKGRLVSESELTERENLAKIVQTASP